MSYSFCTLYLCELKTGVYSSCKKNKVFLYICKMFVFSVCILELEFLITNSKCLVSCSCCSNGNSTLIAVCLFVCNELKWMVYSGNCVCSC